MNLCECGCGQPAPLSRSGKPQRFVRWHRPPKTDRYEVLESGCWRWLLSTPKHGYGETWVDGKRWLAHVYYWVQKNGPVPDGLELDHLCRNRWCCNPDHLEPVTRTENVRRGDKTKLTANQVAVIRRRLLNGEPQRHIAKDYGVTRGAINAISQRQTWVEIDPADDLRAA